MKKKFLLPFVITSLLFVSCSQTSPTDNPPSPVEKIVASLELSNKKIDYYVNETFVKPTVTAIYEDGSRDDVSSLASFSGYDLSIEGNQTVHVSYKNKSTSYQIIVSSHGGGDIRVLENISIGEGKTEFTVNDVFERPVVLAVYDNGDEENVSISASFTGYNMSVAGTYTVQVSYGGKNTSYQITVKDSNVKTWEGNLANIIGKNSNLDGYSTNQGDYFTFSFAKNGASENPSVSNQDGYYIKLLDKAQFTVKGTGVTLSKIELTRQDKIKTFTVDNGTYTDEEEYAIWEGESKQVTFTSSCINPNDGGQNRFNHIKITYEVGEKPEPIIGEKCTIKEVLDIASEIEYLPNDAGWYCSTYTVTVDILAIDAIDSSSSSASEGYDSNARGKVLAIDDTGYMLFSSGTETSPSLSFFQKVKKYLKSGTTTYTVTGKIAFLNDVVEVKVEAATYKENLTFSHTIDDFKKRTIEGSEAFASETHNETVKLNSKGYGIRDVVEIKGLTYFNVYNKEAGSYLFVDQKGQLIPVFSALNKDRSSLEKGKCYDIVGLESMYNGRPSFRILSVKLSELTPTEFDFENSTIKLDSLTPIYSISETSSQYPLSEFNLYSADVLVSTYYEGSKIRYTFNTDCWVINNKCTTGTSSTDSANKYSLDVFNVEEIDYNQSLINYVINDCSSKEEAEEYRVTLYFTLSRLETVNKKNQWRVNVIEDLIFSLDYYNASEASMTFDTSKASCERVDGVYQTWSNSNNSLVVTNSSTSEGTIERRVDYLKIKDATKLVITFDKEIIGFTLYKGSYSYITGLGDLEIEAYKQFAAFFTVKLLVPSKEIVIDPIYIGATGNTDYLKVTSITVKYLED